ncbi:hypothetical protein JTB14_034408 [Gonioctena quinquepunctata]|nr:hypothetical protein JTB14_034408 [Gonioctena quinquepunctata]
MLRISSKWKELIEECQSVEIRIRHYEHCGNLKLHLGIIVTIVMSVGAVEHILINIARFTTCFENDETLWEALEIYFLNRSYPTAFIYTDYSPWKGALLEFNSFQMAFVWNYGDVLIMLMGESLRYKLKQVSDRTESMVRRQAMGRIAWKTIRKDFLSIVPLFDRVNQRLSLLIIVCFCSNLYSVLMQMFRCLMPIDHSIHKAYIYISFGLVLIRITCVILLGSGPNEEWRKIKMVLSLVSSVGYNSEIAGAIVTYELVLIQFNSDLLN